MVEILLTVGYFCGAVPLAVHVGDWKYWRGQGSESDLEMHNINSIISSTEASAVSSGTNCMSLGCFGPI